MSERAGVAAITVTLTKSASNDVTVEYTTVDGEAVASADYVSTSGVLTIPAGSLSSSFTVPLVDDSRLDLCNDFANDILVRFPFHHADCNPIKEQGDRRLRQFIVCPIFIPERTTIISMV